MFRKRGDNFRRQSVSLRGIQRGQSFGKFDSPSKSSGFKSVRPNVPMTGAHGPGGLSSSKKKNNFREFIVSEFQNCVNNFVTRSKKENKDLQKVIKDDKKWLKLLKSGGMDQIFKAKVCEEHFKKVFIMDSYFLKDFLKKFTLHVRGIVDYMCRQLFVKIDKTMMDYFESPEIIIEAIVKGYNTIFKGMEKFQFPLRCMREMISEYLFQHNGLDMVRLLKTHYCDDDMQKKVLRAREFLFVERLSLSDLRLTLPDEEIPYEPVIKILNTLMTVVQIEKLVEILEKAFESIFTAIDARYQGSEVKDVDISLIIAYCLLNCDVHKIPAYIEYIRVFMPKGRKTSIAMMFSDVMRWVVTSITIKMEYEEKREREIIMSSMSIEEQKKMKAKNAIIKKMTEKKRQIEEAKLVKKNGEEEAKKQQQQEENDKILKKVKLPYRPGTTQIPDDIETPKTAESSGMVLPMWGDDDDDDDNNDNDQSQPPVEEEVVGEKEVVVKAVEEPKKADNLVAGFDLSEYGVGDDLSKYGVDSSKANKVPENNQSSNEILNNLDLTAYGVTGFGGPDSSPSQTSPINNTGGVALPSAEVAELKKKLELKERENKELGIHVLNLKKTLVELKGRYTKVVTLCKKLKDESSGSSGGEEVKTLKGQLKKAISKIMELRKENKTLKDKVKQFAK